MASRKLFPAYHGEQPYIFISYAHADSALVLPIAAELHRRHYRVWYDEGIEAGTKWAQYIATHLLASSCVLFFCSKQFNASHNCEREVNFAVDAKKNMARITLDDSELSPGLKMQLSTVPEVRAHESPLLTAERLVQSGSLSDELIGDGAEGYEAADGRAKHRVNKSMIVGIVGILLAACFGFALLCYSKGWCGSGEPTSTIFSVTPAPNSDSDEETQDVEVTTWSSDTIRDLFISQTTGGGLYCCGNAFVSSRIAIDYSDGAFRIGGDAVERGDIADLGTISRMTDLIELTLCFESITDVSALQSLTELTYLDLSGNDVTDISSLTALKNLSTLKLSHTNVTDLTPVLEMVGLQKLYISYDMIGSVKDIIVGGFDIVVTE